MCVRASPSCKGAPSLAVAVLGGRCCDVTHLQFAASHKAWKAEPEVRAGAQVAAGKLDNRELDKLVGALGRSRATWRRALLLHEWLLGLGHAPDDRLCTTLIRVCAQHGQVGAVAGTLRSRFRPQVLHVCSVLFGYQRIDTSTALYSH